MSDIGNVFKFLINNRTSTFGHQASEIALATNIDVKRVRAILHELQPVLFSKRLGTFTLYKLNYEATKVATALWEKQTQ